MPNYLSPGVYIEEQDRGTKPIESVGTATAAFIGFTEKAEDQRDGKVESLLGKSVAVANWSQYLQKFGGFVEGAYLPYSVYGFFLNGGSRCYIVSVRTLGAPAEGAKAIAATALLPSRADKPADTLQIEAKAAGPMGNDIKVTIKDEEGKDTFTIVVEGPDGSETFGGLTLGRGDNNVETVVNAKSKIITVKVLKAAGTLVERRPKAASYSLAGGEMETLPVTFNDYQGNISARTGLGGLEAVDEVKMVAVPDLMTSYVDGEMSLKDVQAVQMALYQYCERIKYCFAILDSPPGLNPQQAREWRLSSNYDSKYAALYYPWIESADMVRGRGTVLLPPSGHMAGLYARVDTERGVHKAPANEVVRGAIGLPYQVTRSEQDSLNPIGVNCIRAFPGRGIRAWGARTVSSDPAWRYINVRRLFNMIEESVERGTQWVVFEPNDYSLWARVRRDVTAYLNVVWHSGALFGATPQEAFYVKCDEELNPPEIRDLGQLIVEIGICPVKPAEFVIFRISQWAGLAAD